MATEVQPPSLSAVPVATVKLDLVDGAFDAQGLAHAVCKVQRVGHLPGIRLLILRAANTRETHEPPCEAHRATLARLLELMGAGSSGRPHAFLGLALAQVPGLAFKGSGLAVLAACHRLVAQTEVCFSFDLEEVERVEGQQHRDLLAQSLSKFLETDFSINGTMTAWEALRLGIVSAVLPLGRKMAKVGAQICSDLSRSILTSGRREIASRDVSGPERVWLRTSQQHPLAATHGNGESSLHPVVLPAPAVLQINSEGPSKMRVLKPPLPQPWRDTQSVQLEHGPTWGAPVSSECQCDSYPSTLVIKNLPRELPLSGLIEAIDFAGFGNIFDLVYLPGFGLREHKFKYGRGYAYINFPKQQDATLFAKVFNGSSFSGPMSKTVLQIHAAKRQGVENVLKDLPVGFMHPSRMPIVRGEAACEALARRAVRALDEMQQGSLKGTAMGPQPTGASSSSQYRADVVNDHPAGTTAGVPTVSLAASLDGRPLSHRRAQDETSNGFVADSSTHVLFRFSC